MKQQGKNERKGKSQSLRQLWSPSSLYYAISVLALVIFGADGFPNSVSGTHEEDLFLMIIIIVAAWLTLALLENEISFQFPIFLFGIYLIFVMNLLMILYAGYRYPFFSVVLILWSSVLIFTIYDKTRAQSPFRRVVVLISSELIFASILTSAGTFVFSYAKADVELIAQVYWLIDLRILLAVLFIGILLSKSIMESFRKKNPTHDYIEPWQLEEPGPGLVAFLMTPFVVLANYIFVLLFIGINLFFRIGTVLVTHFFQIGGHFLVLLLGILKERKMLVLTLRFASSFIIVVCLVSLAEICVTPVDYYLAGEGWPFMLLQLLPICFCVFLMALCIAALLWIVDREPHLAIRDSTSALVVLLSILFVSGVVLHGLAVTDYFQIEGFGTISSIGPFSLVASLLIASGFIYMARTRRRSRVYVGVVRSGSGSDEIR